MRSANGGFARLTECIARRAGFGSQGMERTFCLPLSPCLRVVSTSLSFSLLLQDGTQKSVRINRLHMEQDRFESLSPQFFTTSSPSPLLPHFLLLSSSSANLPKSDNQKQKKSSAFCLHGITCSSLWRQLFAILTLSPNHIPYFHTSCHHRYANSATFTNSTIKVLVFKQKSRARCLTGVILIGAVASLSVFSPNHLPHFPLSVTTMQIPLLSQNVTIQVLVF